MLVESQEVTRGNMASVTMGSDNDWEFSKVIRYINLQIWEISKPYNQRKAHEDI